MPIKTNNYGRIASRYAGLAASFAAGAVIVAVGSGSATEQARLDSSRPRIVATVTRTGPAVTATHTVAGPTVTETKSVPQVTRTLSVTPNSCIVALDMASQGFEAMSDASLAVSRSDSLAFSKAMQRMPDSELLQKSVALCRSLSAS